MKASLLYDKIRGSVSIFNNHESVLLNCVISASRSKATRWSPVMKLISDSLFLLICSTFSLLFFKTAVCFHPTDGTHWRFAVRSVATDCVQRNEVHVSMMIALRTTHRSSHNLMQKYREVNSDSPQFSSPLNLTCPYVFLHLVFARALVCVSMRAALCVAPSSTPR